ncbi:MAG TPA: hypothetical protein VGR00_05415 [Thermoanaerobaculia bacterium]|nr:hypothetical protein [Thermoanaerobaculia bacterium]
MWVAASSAVLPARALAQIPPPPPAATPTPAPTAPAWKTLVGEVVRIDAAHGVIVVGESVKASHVQQGAKRRDPVALTVDRTTKLTRGTRSASFADVKAGDHAVVKYVASASGGRAVSVRLADVAVRSADAGAPAPGASTSSPN